MIVVGKVKLSKSACTYSYAGKDHEADVLAIAKGNRLIAKNLEETPGMRTICDICKQCAHHCPHHGQVTPIRK